jgi:predicted CXXCH cytochrome family protein
MNFKTYSWIGGELMSFSLKTRCYSRIVLWACLFLLMFGASASAQKQPASTTPPSVTWKAPPRGQLSDYVGAQTCGDCHLAEDEAFYKTPHARAMKTSEPARAPGESSSVAAGRKIYAKLMCAGCHAIGGKGGIVGPSLDDVGKRLSRDKIKDVLIKGRPGTVMPMLPKEIPTSRINRLLDYLVSLKGQTQAPVTAAAETTIVVGCEACHGPAREHVEAEQAAGEDAAKQAAGAKLIYNFNGNPKDNADRCLSCHLSGTMQDSFGNSLHLAAGIACQECHSAHLVDVVEAAQKAAAATAKQKPITPYERLESRVEAKERMEQAKPASAQSEFFLVPKLSEENRWLFNSLLKESQPSICFQCHQTVQGQFALSEHHRVPEGFMKCTDCHNPHGNLNRNQLTKVNWETCVTCHVEKRGPFVFEHPAVRVLGCVACHTPHGSVNNFLLKRREQRLLCLQCHTGFHNQAGVPHSRGGYQASGPCTRCHVAVHGSNLDTTLLR